MSEPVPEQVLVEAERLIAQGPSAAGRVFSLVVLVALVALGGGTVWSVVSFVGAILVSDLGVYVVMRVTGAIDTRQLAVPFVREVVTAGAPAVRQAVVMFASPTLLLVVSVVMWLGGSLIDPVQARELALPVTGLALFWLLPLKPFTGWRILNLVLFSRSAQVELAVALVTSLLLGLLGLAIKAWVLVVLAALQVLALPTLRRVRQAAAHLESLPDVIGSTLEALPVTPRSAVLSTIWTAFGSELSAAATRSPKQAAQALVNHAREALLVASSRPPGWGVTGVILAVYGGLTAYFVIAVAVLLLLSRQ